ncbi:glycosyltransferase family 2 protein [Mongoliibacter ruber]|uniref:Glycosyl transferase family 2 n=1 Tax=Mongoliibacter ruber TaxID=1750599 RepID=A0A2T0WMG9_9BACT|nr:glycosyltransferase family 2 protein [Mongoliibacter ruber]PRY87900.1 glycosyl transferase family 2 [Mongoliibacter ruber]
MKKKEKPLVSIICTSFNHEVFIPASLESILKQTYDQLEVILIDNGSMDNSQVLLKEWQEKNQGRFPIKVIFREQAINYCKSFNEGFDLVSGKYFVDLSTDDILLPEHIALSVDKLEENPLASAAFSDAIIISQKRRRNFFPRTAQGTLKVKVDEGWIYEKVVATHHILSSTMMMRSQSFQLLGKYDENLEYEDFDIIVRMAREFPIVFSDHIGVEKHEHPTSFSNEQYQAKTSRMLPSTLRVCQKIARMNRRKSEDEALLVRVFYEWRQALASANFEVAEGFLQLSGELAGKGLLFKFYKGWTKGRWDISGLINKG